MLRSVGILVVAASCSSGAEQRTVPVAPASVTHHFDWRLRVTDSTYETIEAPIATTAGEVAIGFDRWRCEYRIERDARPTRTREEAGYVTCTLASTGARLETMTLCQETDGKPTDRGTSTLRISDAAGQLHSLDFSCKSKSTEWGPEIVEGQGAVGATGQSAPAAPAPAPTDPMARVRDASGVPHFTWKFEIADPNGLVATEVAAVATGPLPAVLQGWACAYQLTPQSVPAFTHLEIGRVVCRSTRGDVAESVMLCAEGPERPTACNLSSLVVTDDAQRRHSMLIGCTNAKRPCPL